LNKFEELGLSKPTLASLAELGYTEPTEIQEQTIALILAGQDVLASAQTGSGKTAAYALPIIEKIGQPSRAKRTRALVLVPTRELALQVKGQFDLLGKHSQLRCIALYGGTGYGPQIKGLHRGADIIVATPGRLLDLVQQNIANLSSVEFVVFDEADRMMDMGFMPQVRNVVNHLKAVRQTLMFSATIDQRIARLGEEYLKSPAVIRAKEQRIDPAAIDQHIHHINEFGKDELLLNLVKDFGTGSVIVFTKTRRKATWVAERLRASNVLAEEIHGDISQNQRERTMHRYRNGQFTVLVATDIAARGLDIPSISHVVNYDLPQTASDYVHRIGRTGRAGKSGIAHTFVSEDQRYLVRDIERLVGRKLDLSTTAAVRPPSKRPSGGGKRFGNRRRVV